MDRNEQVSSKSEKSRKRALLLGGVIVFLLLLSIFVLRLSCVSHHPPPISDMRPETEIASTRIIDNTNAAPLVATGIRPQQNVDTSESSSAGASSTGAVIGNIQSGPFAIVDLQRVLAARGSNATSQEAQSNLVAEIKQIIANRARLHGANFVFDISAKSVLGPPMFIIPTNGVLDITEEVLQNLSH